MTRSNIPSTWRILAVPMVIVLVSGCSALNSAKTPPPAFYALDRLPSAPVPPAAANAPTLIVGSPKAASGFDSQRIIYLRSAHKLEYFSHSEWIDTPARMLAPLIVSALEGSAAFSAVVLPPSAASGEFRLDTEIVRLQHDFTDRPSRVHFTLRAHIVDTRTRRVLAWKEFNASVPASSDDPYGGIMAANLVVQQVLGELATFCADAARAASANR